MANEKIVIVRPWYRGNHEWEVKGVAQGPELIHYSDSAQGEVSYAPKMLLLRSEGLGRVTWFTYWIATSDAGGKMKWGKGSPMLEEHVFLDMLKEVIDKGFFSEEFLMEMYRELRKTLKWENTASRGFRFNMLKARR